jgi:hypothetical protein
MGMIIAVFSGSASSGEYVNPYAGVFPMLLAIIGVMKSWNNRWVRYLAGLAIASFLYSMGSFSIVHGLLYAITPFLWLAREADRFMYLADFSLAVLAGFGVDALLSSISALSWEPLAGVLRWLAISATIVLAFPVVVGKGDMSPWISLSLVLIVLSYCLFNYIIRGRSGRWAKFLVVALILFDLSAFDWSAANRLQESAKRSNYMELLRSSSAVAKFLRAQPGMFRVEIESEWAPNIGDVYAVETTMGNAVTLLTDYDKMRQHSDLLNVRYRVKPASARDPGAVYEDTQWKVFENPGAFPRGWLVHDTVMEPDVNHVPRQLDAPSVDLHRVAIVSPPARLALSPPPADITSESVRVCRPNGNWVESDVTSNGKALLVLSELYYPGWRATVNGHAAEVLRVDGGLRGVIVPGGKCHVAICYRPMSFYLGMISSLGSFLCGGMLLLLSTDRARRLLRLRGGAQCLQVYHYPLLQRIIEYNNFQRFELLPKDRVQAATDEPAAVVRNDGRADQD